MACGARALRRPTQPRGRPRDTEGVPPSTHSLYGALGVLLCAMAVVSLAHRALSRREPRATASPGLPADVTPEVAKLVQAVAPAPPEVARAAEPRPPSPAAAIRASNAGRSAPSPGSR